MPSFLLRKIDKLIVYIRRFPIFNRFPVNFYRFVVIGFTGFTIDFLLFNVLYHGLGFQYRIVLGSIGDNVIALSVPNIISVLTSTVHGYIFNKRWSFENTSDNVASQFSKYVGVALFNNTLNNVIFGVLLYNVFTPLALAPIIATTAAKVLATSFQVISSFLLYKFVVFRDDKEVVSEALVP